MAVIRREEIIGDCRLLLGDCLEIMPTLGPVDAVVTDVASSDAVVYTDKYGQTASRQPEAPARGGGSLGSETPGNRAALHGRNVVASADCGAIRCFPAGDGEGSSSHGDCVEVSLSVGAAEWPVQGRVGEHGLSADDSEGRLRALRGDGKPLHSPQGRGPHEQRPVKFGGDVHELPQRDAQNRVVALPPGWVIVTDPPYGIAWTKPHITNGNSRAHDGIVNDTDCTARDAALAYANRAIVFGSFQAEFPARVKQVLIWQKPGDAGLFGTVAGYRRDVEPVFLCGDWPKESVARSSVLHGKAMFRGHAAAEAGHPHVKPVDLIYRLVEPIDATAILDPFMGSGTTLVACAKLGRKGIGIEISEDYFEIACRRVEEAYRQQDLFVAPPAPAQQLDMLKTEGGA